MKTTFFLLIAFLVGSSALLFGQEDSRSWGRITQKEADMQVFEKDPDAEAVILYDIGQSFFKDTDSGYDIQFTRTKRIKILDQPGIDFAEVTIPYYVDGYGKTEKVGDIEAYSYNYEDGKLSKTALDKSTIFEEVLNERWRAKKFVMPDVKVGTIIEYRYVHQTPFHFNLPDWQFQDKIPTVYSKYTVKMIPFYEYIFIVQGINKFSYQKSEVDKGLTRRFGSIEFNEMVHTYVMENIPAFKDESYMTSMEDYIIKMDFQLSKYYSPRGGQVEIITTWEDLNESMTKHADFGKYIKKSQKIAEDIFENELNVNHIEPYAKAKKIINYVKKSFSWNGYNAKYASKSAKGLITEKTGNAADLNLFLIAMLQAAGIEAKPVLISTRGHGRIDDDYPFAHYFNYVMVLVKVGDKVFFTDGTEQFLAYDRIPPRCINEKGFVVSDDGSSWVNLLLNINSSVFRNIEIEIDPEDLNASTKVLVRATEFESYNLKKSFHNDSSALKEYLVSSQFNEVNHIQTVNYNDPNKPYYMSYVGAVDIERIDDKIIVSPFLDFPIKKNKLTQKSRSYPVDFTYPKAVSLKSKITIPEGYTVADFPKKVEIKNDMAEIVLTYKLFDKVVQVDGDYIFKKSVYQPNEYARIKFYLTNIVRHFNSQLVFEKSEKFKAQGTSE